MRLAILDVLIRLSSFPLTMVMELQQARVIAKENKNYNYPKHMLLKISHIKDINMNRKQHFTVKRQHCKTITKSTFFILLSLNRKVVPVSCNVWSY